MTYDRASLDLELKGLYSDWCIIKKEIDELNKQIFTYEASGEEKFNLEYMDLRISRLEKLEKRKKLKKQINSLLYRLGE